MSDKPVVGMSGRTMMIVAGEASGEMHGAALVAALKQEEPGLSFCGVGGEALTKEGVEILFDAGQLAVVGFTEVFGHLPEIRRALRLIEERLKKEPPCLLILIDFPDFNLIVAKKAKKLGIPVFYYITPQVWAWRSGRVRSIGRLADRIGVILPFEKEFFGQRGISVDFVGHPLLDVVHTKFDRKEMCRRLAIDESCKLVAILPGSRRKELELMLPVFLAAARKIKNENPETVFLFPLASTLSKEKVEETLNDSNDLDIRLLEADRYEAMAACDVAIAASGTVTLELTILGVPMVVAYRLSMFSYYLGRLLIRLPHFSLVNLVAEEGVVEELLQGEATADQIKAAVQKLLSDEGGRFDMKRKLASIRDKLGSPGAAKRAATIALQAARCL